MNRKISYITININGTVGEQLFQISNLLSIKNKKRNFKILVLTIKKRKKHKNIVKT